MSERTKRQGGPFFLGGVFSAMLFGLCFPPADHRVAVWFALVPLLFSLDIHRGSAIGRGAHGLIFGVGLATWFLAPAWSAAHAAQSASGSALPALGATLEVSESWLVLVGAWTAFALLAGPLLRRRSVLSPLLGLPLLWVGLEYLRVERLPVCVPYLTAGTAVDPTRPEARVAALAGLWGIGLLVVFANAALALCLRAGRAARQAALAGIALVAVLLPLLYGHAVQRDAPPTPTVRAGLVQSPRRNRGNGPAGRDSLYDVAGALAGSSPSLIILPGATVEVRGEDGPGGGLETLREFAAEHGVDVLAGATLAPPEGESGPDRAGLVHLDSLGRVAARAGRARRLGHGDVPGVSSGEGKVLETDSLRLGALVDADVYSPAAARRLVARGAEILACCAGDADAPARLAALHARLAAYRAIECGRWLLRATRGGSSAAVDPRGSTAARAPAGIGTGFIASVSPRSGSTWWTRGGWLLGPLSLAFSAVVLLAAAAGPVRKRLGR